MRVTVFALNGVFDSGLAAVLDVLQTAEELKARLPQSPPSWEVTVAGVHSTVRTGNGHAVSTVRFGEEPRPDLIVIPGLSEKDPEILKRLLRDPALTGPFRLLREAHARGASLAAACTGTFLLAESGVLDGLSATTSWWLAPLFRKLYPSVKLEESAMLVREPQITTAGAAFAHIDLALAHVYHSSPALADLVARYLVIDDRPSQAVYTIPSLLAQADPVIIDFEKWVREHLSESFRVAEVARALGVAERTLQRLVRNTLGKSPLEFIHDIRLDQATHLLQTTDLSVQAVARRVGYEHPSTLRNLLRSRRGISVGSLRPRTKDTALS